MFVSSTIFVSQLKKLLSSLITFKIGTLYSKDIREFEVGTNIKNIPEERYTNIRCLESNKALKLWDDFSLCEKRNDEYFYLEFEYDDKYAFNENFEGTQIAGHPVTETAYPNASQSR